MLRPPTLAAQDPITRAELSRTDLEGAPGMEAVIADLTIAPRAPASRNTHATTPNASS